MYKMKANNKWLTANVNSQARCNIYDLVLQNII